MKPKGLRKDSVGKDTAAKVMRRKTRQLFQGRRSCWQKMLRGSIGTFN